MRPLTNSLIKVQLQSFLEEHDVQCSDKPAQTYINEFPYLCRQLDKYLDTNIFMCGESESVIDIIYFVDLTTVTKLLDLTVPEGYENLRNWIQTMQEIVLIDQQFDEL